MNRDLEELIEEFLKDRKLSDGGNWAEVTKLEENELYDIIYKILELKYERDCDDDLPVTVQIIDKTKFEYSLPELIPHFSYVKDQDKNRVLAILNRNLQMASDRLDTFIRIKKLVDN